MRRNLARKASAEQSKRQGSTIVVVIALLLALTFLGIVGYTIGTQEHSNAQYFAQASKRVNFGISQDDLFDWGLRQVILGTRLEERQSALHGGHMSLMATLFGRDLAPYTGQGVHLGMNSGNIYVDQNHDGAADGGGAGALLEINRAPFSRGASGVGATNLDGYPTPDVGYTYWDNNNPFLAYVNEDHLYNSGGTEGQLVIPSFHRPQYLRETGLAQDQWYTDPSTQGRVLRPHAEHRAVAEDGTVTETRRFVSTIHPDTRAVPVAEQLQAFPFQTNSHNMTPVNEGVWEGIGSAGNDNYDADPDGDGVHEAVYLDLDFPMQTRDNPDGTVTNYVPMFAFTIYDADALFNLNAHGNVAGVNEMAGGFGLTGDSPYQGDPSNLDFLSTSNEALAASEVNPEWGMTANAGDTTQHQRFYEKAFGSPPGGALSGVEIANMEWWWLLSGRADYDVPPALAVQNLYPGRFGEISDLSGAAAQSPLMANNFPKPGRRFGGTPNGANFNLNNPNHLRTDDNLTSNLGASFNDSSVLGGTIQVANTVFPPSVNFPAWRHPLDLRALGRKTEVNQPKQRFFFQATNSYHQWPAYDNYDVPTVGLRNSTYANNLMQGYDFLYLVDEPEETVLEPSRVRSDLDSIFGAGENAALHLSQTDQNAVGLSGRTQNLAPINFNDTGNLAATEARRRRYTTTSWDLKSYGRSTYPPSGTPDKFRTWETDNNFPPQFSGAAPANDPFRPALRELLQMRPGINQLALTDLQRKLSVNDVLDYDPNGRLRFRPLTPHPTGLDANPIGTYSGLTRPEQLKGSLTDERQEWLARRDRQKLCRDIYVLLYTLGGGDDSKNYTTALYPDNENGLRVDMDGDGVLDATDGVPDDPHLMAQFAVNLVDRMDEDDVVTVFEYDADLTNGWNLDDNAFDANEPGVSPAPMPNERQVVYGVEEQQLCLNEAELIIARRVLDDAMPPQPTNHDATEYDDQKNRDWSFIELENVGVDPVQLGNGNWQLIIERDPADMSGSLVSVRKRWLTLLGNWTVGTGNNPRFTIGTTGDLENRGAEAGLQQPMTEPLVPSHFRVDRDHNPTGTPPPMHDDPFGTTGFQSPEYRIAPRGGLNLDLITAPSTTYSVFPDDPMNPGIGANGDLPGTPGHGEELFGHTGDDQTPPVDALDGISGSGDLPRMKITLRRRVNPTRPGPTDQSQTAANRDNPWVVVDEMRNIPIRVFALEEDDEFMEIRPKLSNLKSSERNQPLSSQHHNYAASPADFKFNSLGQVNFTNAGVLPTAYNLYQPHFDRPYSSLTELLSIPLYGQERLTTELRLEQDPSVAAGTFHVAAHKFLRPDADPTMPGPSTPADLDNRWYRLFEYLEVPDRSPARPTELEQNLLAHPPFVHDLGGTGFVRDLDNNGRLRTYYRRPGRIQLNTLRDPEVLGGLLDDPQVARLGPGGGSYLPDASGSGGHDWWRQFIQSRDGIDPVTSSYLPGLPVAKPFRDFNFTAEGNTSIDETLLRNLPLDTTPGEERLLFELGNNTEHTNGTVDQTIRHRMLSKVMNNSTNRSNVFLIFMQVDFFEAAEVTDPMTGKNVVRVGGKLADSPGHRGFFVVDRSKIFEMLSQNPALDAQFSFLPSYFHDPQEPTQPPPGSQTSDPNDPSTWWKFNYSFHQDFDFHPMILHRETIN